MAGGLWQNREVRFNVDNTLLYTFPGETVIDHIYHVQDMKCKDGEHGRVRLTNFRLFWKSDIGTGRNVSIGYEAIVEHETGIHYETGETPRKRDVIKLTTDTGDEFSFGAMTLSQHTRFYMTLESALRSYNQAKMEVEMVVQGPAINDAGNLRLVPMEQFNYRVCHVWNLAPEKNITGTLFITNWRIVWCAQNDFSYSLSIPYLRLSLVRIYKRSSGPLLVLKANTSSREDQVFGMRVFPNEKQAKLCQQIQMLLKTRQQNPMIGTSMPEEQGLTRAELAIMDVPLSRLKRSDGYTTLQKEQNFPTVVFQ